MQTPAVSKLGRTYGLHPSAAHSRKSVRLWHEPDPSPWAGFQRAYAMGLERPGPEVLHGVASGFTCDYSSMLRPPRDQGQEGSCGAHAWAALKEHNAVRWEVDKGGPSTPLGGYLSVAHLYWNIRLAMGTFPDDSGTDNTTAASVLQGVGVCPEAFLPYQCNPRQAGNAQCNVAGIPYRVGQPVLVPLTEAHFDAVLARGRVIVLGFSVYASFEDTGPDGVVPPLRPGEGLLGGHDTLVCGKRADGLYKVRNSWSYGWGDRGYFYVSPAYIAATGMDGWTSA